MPIGDVIKDYENSIINGYKQMNKADLMRKAKLSILYFGILFSQLGCGFFDYEKSENKQIVGNFYIVNLHLKEHPGFFLVFKERSGHERIFLGINEYIDYLKANSSMILIKTRPNPEVSYYLVEHNYGDTVLNFKKIFADDFENYELSMKVQYRFQSGSDTD